MKKFSKITNQKVNEEPKLDSRKIDESDIIKYKMIDLMNKYLSVTTYGPVINYDVAGTIKISGKEMLAEAISDMLIELSNNDKTKLLESLKTEVRDWEVIDNKIESLNVEKVSLPNKNKINKFIEMYKDDEDFLLTLSESKISKVNNVKTIIDYTKIIKENKNLNDKTKSKLVEIYSNRIKQIESGE